MKCTKPFWTRLLELVKGKLIGGYLRYNIPQFLFRDHFYSKIWSTTLAPAQNLTKEHWNSIWIFWGVHDIIHKLTENKDSVTFKPFALVIFIPQLTPRYLRRRTSDLATWPFSLLIICTLKTESWFDIYAHKRFLFNVLVFSSLEAFEWGSSKCSDEIDNRAKPFLRKSCSYRWSVIMWSRFQ